MGFSYGTNFDVLHISADPSDRHEFDELMAPDGHWEKPARRLVDLMIPLCQSVVVERNYIDSDYRAGYARFHYLRHQDTSRRCTRLHFFADQLTKGHLIKMPHKIKAGYLGFLVLRPLPAFRLGRSILSDRLAPEVSSQEKTYITCRTKYRANLVGNELQFSGVSWMEQDTLVSACASAALWMACCHMAHKLAPELKEYCTPDITDMATRTITTGRPMPSEGLTTEQMLYALQEMGYEPVSYVPTGADAAHNITYRYVESEIPVLIILQFSRGGHAVTAIGHTHDLTRKAKTETLKIQSAVPLSICRTSDFAPRIVVQDDAGGPFRYLEFIEWAQAVNTGLVSRKQASELKRRYGCVALFDRGAQTQEVGFLQALMVPLPQGITLDGYGAEIRAILLTANWYQVRGITPPKDVAFRTFLQPSNTFKMRWESVTGVPSILRREFRRHLMSKWIWVTEVADLHELCTDNKVLGQIVQDSASHATSPDFFDLLGFHLPGCLATVQTDRTFDIIPIPAQVRYARFTRNS
jgi:hypothetical protein